MADRTANINILRNQPLEVPYDPKMPTWKFCQFIGRLYPALLSEDKKTLMLSLLIDGQPFNTYPNRDLPIGKWLLGRQLEVVGAHASSSDPLFRGNASHDLFSHIRIHRIDKPFLVVPFDPDESMWRFCRRIDTIEPGSLLPDRNTLTYRLVANGHVINSYSQRLSRMEELLLGATEIVATNWRLDRVNREFTFSGNAFEEGPQREVCTLCHRQMTHLPPEEEEPLILRCGHAFHRACYFLKTVCPTCSSRDGAARA